MVSHHKDILSIGPLSFLGGSGVTFGESSGGTGGTDEDVPN